MALEYKLEYNKNDEKPSDEAVYIQLRRNTPVYQAHIDKEAYDILPEENKHEFLTGLFNIGGVVEVSSKAYRVWISKSPSFTWSEVLDPLLVYMKEYYGEDDLEEMAGSGIALDSSLQRRDI